MQRDEFIACFGKIFEHSSWVAEQAWEAGIDDSHDDVATLHDLLASIVRNADAAKRQRLIDGHPQLAAPVPDGDAHAASRGEQARAGLASLNDEQRARFAQLNADYRQKFGFPFILAVEGLASDEILAAFERRTAEGETESERRTALDEVIKIGLLRLRKL